MIDAKVIRNENIISTRVVILKHNPIEWMVKRRDIVEQIQKFSIQTPRRSIEDRISPTTQLEINELKKQS